MAKYRKHYVEIVIKEDSELYARLVKLSKISGRPLNDLISSALQAGAYGHMENNLTLMEKLYVGRGLSF